MGKVSLGMVSLAFLAAFAVTFLAPAAASLVPLSFGFPVIVQNGQTTAFSNSFASSTDNEIMDISFPAFDGMMSSEGTPSTGLGSWQGQGMAMPDLSNMGSLFDFSGFNLF
jgi:hypothetical protein